MTGKNTFSSIILANMRNIKYMTVQQTPTFQSNLNLLNKNAQYKPHNVDSNEPAEYAIPLDFKDIKC